MIASLKNPVSIYSSFIILIYTLWRFLNLNQRRRQRKHRSFKGTTPNAENILSWGSRSVWCKIFENFVGFWQYLDCLINRTRVGIYWCIFIQTSTLRTGQSKYAHVDNWQEGFSLTTCLWKEIENTSGCSCIRRRKNGKKLGQKHVNVWLNWENNINVCHTTR